MRVLLLLVVLGAVVLCVTLFVAGLVGRRDGRVAEKKMRRTFRKLERKGDGNAGWLGDWTKRVLAWVRRLAQKSAAGGRSLRERVNRERSGSA